MADFFGAIRKGIASAVEKDREGKEIGAVLSHFNQNICDFSNNTLELIVDRADVMTLYMDRTGENYYRRLKIAEISTLVGGYPCVVRYGSSEHACNTREELEEALAKRLATPEIGKEILLHLGSA